MEFIETKIFEKKIKEIATDDELKELQVDLIAQPEKGKIIEGTGGLRKVRMAMGDEGKSGGARVIYFLATSEVIYLVLAYAKGEKDSLTKKEKNDLKKVTKLLKGEN
nr:type II toxin-antitoxin system RelE/ParE family toxin [Ferrimonas kyonanensis]